MDHSETANHSPAWRCDGCGALMYALDSKGYPAPGAPPSDFISTTYRRVCNVCKDMWDTVSNIDYWRTIERESKAARDRRSKKNDGLSGKTDYFTGA